jgi:cell wall-associated NlpC family hydrolase
VKIYITYILIIYTAISFVACKSHKTITTSTGTKEDKKNTPTKSTSLKKKYAEILGVSESDIKNNNLYQFINEWYGVPYKYAGKDKNGIDCSGLTSTLYAKVYDKKISPSTKVLIDEVKKIKSSDLKEGDLVFFNIGSSHPTHVGVYLQNHKFVHASTKKGVMISDLNEPYFKKYFYSAGRVK